MAGERCSFPQEIGRNGGNLLPFSFYQQNHHHHHNHYDGGGYDVDDGDGRGRGRGNLLPSLVLPAMMMIMDIVIMMMISLK